jgi:integrase
MASIKAKITKRLIDSLKPAAGEELFVWDTELTRYGFRIKPSGLAAFLILYRTRHARQRMHTFAKAGTLTPEEARAKARRLLAEVDDGGDPAQRRAEAREALTIAELCEKYLEAARAGLVMTRFRKAKRDSTVAIDEGRVSRHIVPLIGKKTAGELTRPDVQNMTDTIAAGKTAGTFKTKVRGKAVVAGGPGTAARVVELLGGIWSWAEKRGFVSAPNPTRGVEKHQGDARERILSADELTRLGAALREQEPARPMAVAALRLIALTGLRREEACGLRWQEIDFIGSCLRLEQTKTGRSLRPIGKAALDLLSELPRLDDVFVFPNKHNNGHADLKKGISSIFDAAHLKGAGAQTLRRTFASVAADEGYSDATIAELLGHARRGVTARHYIRRPDAALVAAADRVAARVAAALAGSHGADIVPMKSGR